MFDIGLLALLDFQKASNFTLQTHILLNFLFHENLDKML